MRNRSAADRESRRTRIVLALLSGVLMGISIPTMVGALPASPGPVPAMVATPAVPPASAAPVPAAQTTLNESTLVLFNNTIVKGDLFSVSSSLPSLEVFDPKTNQVFVEGFYSGVIDVVSGKLNKVVATISTGEYPNTLAYDSQTHNIFFGLQTDDLVALVNGSTDLIERSVNIGFEPLAMAADPATGDLFVTGTNSTGTAFVAVLSGSVGTVVTTFPFGADRFPIAGPNGLDFDPGNGDFYIASVATGSPPGTRGNLTVVNGSEPSVLRNISLEFNPDAILYAPSIKEFYLGNQSGDDLSVFDPASAKVVKTVSLPNTPSLLTYGSLQKQVYVGIDGNVSVVNTLTEKVVHTFPVTRQPDGLAFDTHNGYLYISDYVWNNVSAVNTTSYSVAVGSILLGALPYNMAYDTANGDLYVADLESSQLIVVSGSTHQVVRFVPLGTTPYGIVYDPVTKDLYVDDYYADNVSIVSGTTNSVIGYLPAGVEPWGIAYDGANRDVYVTNPGSNNITVLNPTTGKVAANLGFTTAPGAIAYDPESKMLFVGEYDVGNVSILSATSNKLIRNSTAGSEPYTISVDPGTGRAFVGNYASDNVTVLGPMGQELGLSVATGAGNFGSVYDPVSGDVFVVSFGSDMVTVINSTTATGVGGYEVGSGPVAAAVDPAGTIFVANYDSGSLTLLTRPLWFVTFTESGLPSGQRWSVAFDGSLKATTGASLGFTVTNGTYGYLVAGPSGYAVSGLPPEGKLLVSGNTVQPVHFVKGSTYSLDFAETGLPKGTSWCVTVGSKLCTTTSGLSFSNLTNGTYTYTVDRVAGYTASPASGQSTIAGASVKISVGFST